jgi:hypothetical protein
MTSKLFNCPFQSIILRYIDSATSWTREMWILNIFWNWNKNINIVCDTSFFVIAFNFD